MASFVTVPTWGEFAYPTLEAAALGAACAALFLGLRGVPRPLRTRLLVAYALGVVGGAVLLGLSLAVAAPRGVAPVAAFGALAGGTWAVWLAARWLGVDRGAALLALAPSLGLLVCIGRLGCFAAGCCFGRPTAHPFGVVFAVGSPAQVTHVHAGLVLPDQPSLPVHPTQLYESALGAAMVLASWAAARRGLRVGAALLSLGLYAAGRLALEAMRGDPRGLAGPLTVAQWLAIATLAAIAASAAREPT